MKHCPTHYDLNVISCRNDGLFEHVTYGCGCTIEVRMWLTGDVVLVDNEIFRVDDSWEDEDGEEYLLVTNMHHEDVVSVAKATYIGEDTLSWKVKAEDTFKPHDFVSHVRLDMVGEVIRVYPGNLYDIEVWSEDKQKHISYRWSGGSLNLAKAAVAKVTTLKEGQYWQPKSNTNKYFPDNEDNYYKPRQTDKYSASQYKTPKVKPKQKTGHSVADFIKEEVNELSKEDKTLKSSSFEAVNDDEAAPAKTPFIIKRKGSW